MAAVTQSGAIAVKDALLRYEIVGDGQPIVVLHGGPGIGYRYLAPELETLLAGKRRIVFYDQRGSGESTGADDPSLLNIHAFVEDLACLCTALELERAVLLGHSFGGLLAMHYAIQYPQRVTALILVDPDPASKALWSRFTGATQGKRTPAEAEEISAIQASNGWNANSELVARYFELALRPFFAALAVPERFGHRFVRVRPDNLSTTAAAVRNNLGDWDLHPLLNGIGCPTLLVCGETGIFPEEAMAKLHEGIRKSTLVRIGGASHFPSIEAPGAFGSAVCSFLGVERGAPDSSDGEL